MEGKTLEDYLQGLKECDNPDALEKDFFIRDNWLALLYGNSEELFAALTSAYKNPQENGLEGKWEHNEEGSSGTTQKFHLDYQSGVMTIQLVRQVYEMFVSLGKSQINGSEHSMYVSMHPYGTGTKKGGYILKAIEERSPEGIEALKAMKAAVVEFCEYLVTNKITFRLPYSGINFIPK